MLLRIGTVLERFGITSRRFEQRLSRYSDITAEFGCVPTFPIPAVTLRRHPELIRKLSRKGIEFAVHGNIHGDYKLLSPEEQTRHLKKAIDNFRLCQIPFTGFRAPYLRATTETPEVLSNLEFLYDSSRAICWDVIDKTKYPKERRSEVGFSTHPADNL